MGYTSDRQCGGAYEHIASQHQYCTNPKTPNLPRLRPCLHVRLPPLELLTGAERRPHRFEHCGSLAAWNSQGLGLRVWAFYKAITIKSKEFNHCGAFWDGSPEEIGETADDPLHFTLYTAILSTLIQASVLIDQVCTTMQIPDCWPLFLEGPRMRTQKYSLVGKFC